MYKLTRNDRPARPSVLKLAPLQPMEPTLPPEALLAPTVPGEEGRGRWEGEEGGREREVCEGW